MARSMPEHRIKDLLVAATAVFIEQGYRRTQMADVAERLGVAKGTLYLYVESKEALFDAAMRSAGGLIPDPDALSLPIATPKLGALRRLVRARLAEAVVPPTLERALARRRVADAAGELEEIVRDLFATSLANRTAVKLIDRCPEHPELEGLFYQDGRAAQLESLERYLEARIRRGHLRDVPNVPAAARFIVESVATWAVHVHWDPAPQALDARAVEETLVHFLLSGLLPS
jgi:AcrR family transcriptional regulator